MITIITIINIIKSTKILQSFRVRRQKRSITLSQEERDLNNNILNYHQLFILLCVIILLSILCYHNQLTQFLLL